MQELNQVMIKESIGKTIAKVHVSYRFVAIIYTDNSFSCFKEYDNWGLTSIEDTKIKYEIFIENLGIREDGSVRFTSFQEFLIDAGILDGDKLIEDAKDHIDKVVSYIKDRDYKHYLELKEKFKNSID